MDGKFEKIKCPTLLLCGTSDPFVYPDFDVLAERFSNRKTIRVKGGTITMIDQMPSQIGKILIDFL